MVRFGMSGQEASVWCQLDELDLCLVPMQSLKFVVWFHNFVQQLVFSGIWIFPAYFSEEHCWSTSLFKHITVRRNFGSQSTFGSFIRAKHFFLRKRVNEWHLRWACSIESGFRFKNCHLNVVKLTMSYKSFELHKGSNAFRFKDVQIERKIKWKSKLHLNISGIMWMPFTGWFQWKGSNVFQLDLWRFFLHHRASWCRRCIT